MENPDMTLKHFPHPKSESEDASEALFLATESMDPKTKTLVSQEINGMSPSERANFLVDMAIDGAPGDYSVKFYPPDGSTTDTKIDTVEFKSGPSVKLPKDALEGSFMEFIGDEFIKITPTDVDFHLGGFETGQNAPHPKTLADAADEAGYLSWQALSGHNGNLVAEVINRMTPTERADVPSAMEIDGEGHLANVKFGFNNDGAASSITFNAQPVAAAYYSTPLQSTIKIKTTAADDGLKNLLLNVDRQDTAATIARRDVAVDPQLMASIQGPHRSGSDYFNEIGDYFFGITTDEDLFKERDFKTLLANVQWNAADRYYIRKELGCKPDAKCGNDPPLWQ